MTNYTVKVTEYDTENFPSRLQRFAGRVDFQGDGWPRHVERYADTLEEVISLLKEAVPEALQDRRDFNDSVETYKHVVSTKEIELTV